MTAGSNGSLGVVIPAYNPDVETLISYLNDIQDTLNPNTLRIELDDPLDETTESLRDCHLDIIIATTNTRRGKGKAITDGFNALDTDYLLFADSDGSTTVDSLRELVNVIEKDTVDVSVGTRRHPDSNVLTHQSRIRRYLGDTFVHLNRIFLRESLTDYQCGAKVFTAGTWRKVEPFISQSGFAWDIEVIAVGSGLGLSIVEVPITWEDNRDSTVSLLHTPLEMLVGMLKSAVTYRRCRSRSVSEDSSLSPSPDSSTQDSDASNQSETPPPPRDD